MRTTPSSFERIRKILSPSLVLVLSNCIPLLGILFLGWSVLETIALYWLESAVVAICTLVLLLLMPILPADREGTPFNAKFFLIPFFVIHFSIFMGVHLLVILFFLGDLDKDVLHQVAGIFWNNTSMRWSILSLLLSHGYSFFTYEIATKKYLEPLRKDNLWQIMARPYKRVVVMQLTVLLSAAAILILRLPQPMAVAMVVIKTYFDLKSHKKEHEEYASVVSRG